jgi:very-short-patch-repair endonuclease
MDTTCLHEWEIIPNNLIARGNGTTCRVCTPVLSVLKKTHEQFVTELHLAAPELVLLDTYVCSHTAIRVQGVCKHIWPIIPNNIISASSGIVCRVCAPKQVSKGEVEMAEYVNAVLVNDRKILGGKELDIVLEDIKLALEYNGEYWHSDLYKSTTYHLDKLNACKEKGYQLIQIWEHEWQNKQDIVKSILNAKLGKALSVGARKCVIKEIPFPGDFLDDNHLQGRGSPTKINLGLFYKDILAAVMTFGTPRFTAQQDYELVRLCTLTGIVVQGGASKLFKYFRAKYKGSVLSYSDKRWGTGKVYEHLGFTYSHSSPPGYFYYNGSKKLSRYQCQKHKLQVLFPELFTHEKTEKEIMKEAGYYRCYDCGNDVYVIE